MRFFERNFHLSISLNLLPTQGLTINTCLIPLLEFVLQSRVSFRKKEKKKEGKNRPVWSSLVRVSDFHPIVVRQLALSHHMSGKHRFQVILNNIWFLKHACLLFWAVLCVFKKLQNQNPSISGLRTGRFIPCGWECVPVFLSFTKRRHPL